MNKELLEGLETGLNNEIVGEEFYTKTADEAKDEFTKNTFIHLAKDEMDHIKRIKNFVETKKAGKIEKEIKQRNPKSGLKFFGMSVKKFKKKKEKFKRKKFGPYKFAIEIEIKSYELYQRLLDKSKDKKTKELFKFLIKEEKTHKKILEETLNFMKSPEDYFLETEGWHFD